MADDAGLIVGRSGESGSMRSLRSVTNPQPPTPNPYLSDSNNATWYLLRYEEDFTPPKPGAPALPVPPEIDGPLAYDPARHVLELLPKTPEEPVRPLPGLAVD